MYKYMPTLFVISSTYLTRLISSSNSCHIMLFSLEWCSKHGLSMPDLPWESDQLAYEAQVQIPT